MDASDATMILYYAIYKEWPVAPLTRQKVEAAAGPVRFSLGNVNGQPGATVTTTLSAENLSSWAGGKFVIAYDPALIKSIANVSVTGLAANFSIQFHDNKAGLLYITMADETPVSGNGALLTIAMVIAPNAVNGSSAPLTLAEARLNDGLGRDFVTSALQRTVERKNGQVQIGGTQQQSVYLPMVIK